MAVAFCSLLYTNDVPSKQKLPQSSCFPPSNEKKMHLIHNLISKVEIKNVIFSMGALKALGPDGLHALFFQSQWDVVGDLFCSKISKIFENPK